MARKASPLKASSPGKRAKVVTETLGTSARTVGALSVFGIKELWRVPTLLPKRYLDVRHPLTRFDRLSAGQWVCIGGVPSNARLVHRGSQAAYIIEEFAEEGDEGVSDVCENSSDVDSPPALPSVLPGEASQTLLDASGPDDVWHFDLTDLHQLARIRVELLVSTNADRALLHRVNAGEAVWLHGLIAQSTNGLFMQQTQVVASSELGEVLAFYPSKSMRHTVRERSKRTKKLVERTYLRKISSATTCALVREKNRLAIARCAQVLRDRMGIVRATDEWELLRVLDSPAPTIDATFKVAHTPPDLASGLAATRALELLCAVELLQHIRRQRDASVPKSHPISSDPKHFAAAVQSLRLHGIVPTHEQRLVAMEILADLSSDRLTHRMLSGDVGSGKTIVFAIVAACVHAAGHLVVVLEPRAQLAQQVFEKLNAYFPQIPMQLITSGSTDQAINSGVIVGTTGVWSRLAAAGCTPGVIVCDEQHKLGVGQRKPPGFELANVLEATATPIPRTQGLIEFGGIDVSVLRRCHVKKTVHTKVVVGSAELIEAYDTVARRIEEEQKNLLLIFPQIGGDDDSGARANVDMEAPQSAVLDAVHVWELQFPGRVGLIHGRMSDEERSLVIDRFQARQLDILIGTAILEVGFDFRQADMMVVHHPERLGVAAVHQLRGRLVRQGGHGWCYLAPSPGISKEQLALFQLMEVESDGFKLALSDMERRGVGDMRLHARQQSGEYEGFLVQRPPTVADLEWAIDNAGRWVGAPAQSLDLLQDPVALLGAMASIGRTERRKKAAAVVTSPPHGDQISLFPQTGSSAGG